MAVALRCQRERVRSRDHLLAGVAVRAVTGQLGRRSGVGLAAQPAWEEGADDMVPGREPCHAFAHLDDLARAVRHWDSAVVDWDEALDHHQVMVVQRTGVQPHPDLARTDR